MKYVAAAQCAADFEQYLRRAVRYNEAIGISSEEGNAVLMSEEEYDALMETLFILRSEQTRLDIAEAAAEAVAEAIPEEDVDWN